jgi:hypothetical protein
VDIRSRIRSISPALEDGLQGLRREDLGEELVASYLYCTKFISTSGSNPTIKSCSYQTTTTKAKRRVCLSKRSNFEAIRNFCAAHLFRFNFGAIREDDCTVRFRVSDTSSGT